MTITYIILLGLYYGIFCEISRIYLIREKSYRDFQSADWICGIFALVFVFGSILLVCLIRVVNFTWANLTWANLATIIDFIVAYGPTTILYSGTFLGTIALLINLKDIKNYLVLKLSAKSVKESHKLETNCKICKLEEARVNIQTDVKELVYVPYRWDEDQDQKQSV